jgi:alkylation response protein AidB-like acyl-CoA dehydrogenase
MGGCAETMSDPTSIASWIGESWRADGTLSAWWHRLADAGCALPTWPLGFGGTGASGQDARRIATGARQSEGPRRADGQRTEHGGLTLLAHGIEEQIHRFVTPMVQGRVWAQLFSEPGDGSDLASFSTRAERDGDEFVINGQKVWNSFADVSDWGMLLARTDVDQPKHRGITFMMIDMNQPGVSVRPLVQMNGHAEFCEVFLTDARVPAGNVIGGVNDGWKDTRTTLAFERSNAGGGRTKGLATIGAPPP